MWILAGVTLIALLTGAVLYARSIPDWYQGSDEAIIEIDTLHAINGLTSGSLNAFWAFGPYSRYGWRHPGPLYFYLLAPVYAAGGFGTPALKVGAFLINLAALLGIAWAIRKHLAPLPGAVVMATFTLFAVRAGAILPSVWNPHVVILPFVATVLFAAAVAIGRAGVLVPLAATASFVAQTNVALVPEVATVVGASLVLLFRRHTAGGRSSPAEVFRLVRRPLIGAAVVSLVLWAPALFDQVHSRNGNLGQLIAFFTDGQRRGQLAIDAWRAFADSLSSFTRWAIAVPWGSPLVMTKGWPATVIALLLVVALHRVRSTRIAGAHPYLRALGVIVVAGSVVALWSCTRIEDEINGYGVFWISALGMLGTAALAGYGAAWLAGRVRFPDWPASAATANLIVVACALIVAGAGALKFQAQRSAAERRVRLEPVIPRLVDGMRLYMVRMDVRRPVLEIRGQWGDAAGVLLNLYRRGQRLAVNPDREFMFGPQFRRSGTEDREFEISERANHRELKERPGDMEIAAYGETCLHTIDPLLLKEQAALRAEARSGAAPAPSPRPSAR